MKKKFRTKKSLGQHLLIAKGVIEKIVDYIQPEGEIIVEIGVGTGQLTEAILQRNPKILYGIEIDETAYPIIEERLGKYENFVLIKKDYFDVNIRELVNNEKFKLVGNLPYNVASLIIIDSVNYIDILKYSIFMVQKEVAEKLISKPKKKSYTFMTVYIQTFFEVEYLMSVPPRFFSPPPKVVSAVVKLTPKENPPIPLKEAKEYKGFISKLFSNKRKMLRTKIDKEILEKAGIKETLRVDELNLEDFIKLYKTYKELEKKDN
jgi:16S rRNA (adenine1518-N6/adenine1519-N6)-dimethyltransferase